MCSEGRPRRLAREFRDDLVALAVERVNDLGSDELLGCHVEPVGVALNGVEQPGSWVVEFSQQCCGEMGLSSRARICYRVSVGAQGGTVSGRMRVCGSPSPTTCR